MAQTKHPDVQLDVVTCSSLCACLTGSAGDREEKMFRSHLKLSALRGFAPSPGLHDGRLPQFMLANMQTKAAQGVIKTH